MKMPELKQFARLQNIEFMSTILRYATIGHVVHEEIQVFYIFISLCISDGESFGDINYAEGVRFLAPFWKLGGRFPKHAQIG